VWALLAAGAATACGLGWLFVVHRRLRRVLRARRPETDSRVLTTASEVARALGLQQSPHISRSEAIATPIAFGSMRPEICLPVRVGELSAQSLRAMLAHEVAHLRAADPTWMWGAAWLQALFPWQFLFAVVRRRWARLVELRCDAIAAEHATPTAVARCLLDVADWLRPGPEGTVVALGMAARPSALRERVEAALHGRSRRPVRRSVSRALGGLALTALTAGAPAVATEGALGGVLSPAALLSALPTDEGVRSLDRAALRRMSSALQGEHARVVAEAERLRAELRTLFPTPELTGMQATLDRRLADLSKLRTRLDALLAHTDSTDR
jgi:beta-lactamase regulating signal transducer with metallopeptidase domain